MRLPRGRGAPPRVPPQPLCKQRVTAALAQGPCLVQAGRGAARAECRSCALASSCMPRIPLSLNHIPSSAIPACGASPAAHRCCSALARISAIRRWSAAGSVTRSGPLLSPGRASRRRLISSLRSAMSVLASLHVDEWQERAGWCLGAAAAATAAEGQWAGRQQMPIAVRCSPTAAGWHGAPFVRQPAAASGARCLAPLGRLQGRSWTLCG